MKILKLLIILFLFLFLTDTYAEDIVISSDTTWSGNLEIDKNIEINKNATLTIMPGTKILMTKKSNSILSINVKGNLKAIGTEKETIKFFHPSGMTAIWSGIFFNDSKKSELIYCDISNADTGITCIKSSPIIANNDISFCVTGIKISQESKPILQGNLIRDNTRGLICESGTSVLIYKNNFISNTDYALSYKEAAAPTIIGNNFTKNHTGIYAVRPQSIPIISSNIFTENNYGIYFSQTSGGDIDNCMFSKNKNAIYSTMMTTQRVINSTFIKNNTALTGHTWASFEIEYCNIIENTIGISLSVASGTKITRNNILKNNTGIEAEICSSSNMPKIDENNLDNKDYNIFSFLNSKEISTKIDSKTETISTNSNWWGEVSTNELKNGKTNLTRIYDYYDNPIGIYRGSIIKFDKIDPVNWQTSRLIDCGVQNEITETANKRNMELILNNNWKENKNELKKAKKTHQ